MKRYSILKQPDALTTQLAVIPAKAGIQYPGASMTQIVDAAAYWMPAFRGHDGQRWRSDIASQVQTRVIDP